MTSFIYFFFLIPVLTLIFLLINFFFSTYKPYIEKKSTFECGYHSFLGQNRAPFNISFFIVALMFLLFDLEILLIYPFSVSSYTNSYYGLIFGVLIFVLVLTLGLIYELGKNALNINKKQK